MTIDFHSELALANTNAAAYSSIAITANMTSGTNNVTVTNTGHAFLPKTPEQFQHDADGNLISDGRWQYTWDAENRLLAIETLPNLPTNVPVQKLLFQYDAQSRRISKVVSNYSGSAWSETSNLKFVYDGWNLLVEVDKTNAVVRSYCWGLDLSGSPTGAGGIAGLLFGTFNGSSSTSSVAYAFDGNGNVTSFLDMRTGQLAAEYEYSPFGETIRATGPLAKENPFRFSAKYTDSETSLLYYGYRYYQPNTGRWLSRDPIADEVFLRRFVAPMGWKAQRHWREQSRTSVYVFVKNFPLREVDHLGLGLNPFDGKYYGNWCGGGWTGGKNVAADDYNWADEPAGVTLTDFVDNCCREHDACYAGWDLKKGDKADAKTPKNQCDDDLCSCTKPERCSGKRPPDEVGWVLS